MANMFMKLGDLECKGSATAVYTGGEGVGDKGWFAISTLSWEAKRSVSMDIGNGMNRDSGMVGMSHVTVTREMDGASENLLSRMYVPGDDGDTVDVIVTKPDRAGKGHAVYLQIQLTNARIVNYDLSVADGTTPFENVSLAYSEINVKHWNEGEGGKLEAGGDVSFDLKKGTSPSHSGKG